MKDTKRIVNGFSKKEFLDSTRRTQADGTELELEFVVGRGYDPIRVIVHSFALGEPKYYFFGCTKKEGTPVSISYDIETREGYMELTI